MIETAQWDRFMEQIGQNANIGEACEIAGIHRATFYARKKEDPEFSAAYANAMEGAMDKLERAAWKRAVDGVEEAFTTKDGTTVTTTKYADGLLQFLLKAHRPGKFKDKITQEHTGPDGQPLAPAVVLLPEVKAADPE